MFNIKNFLKLDSLGGPLLVVSTILALVLANSPFSHFYSGFFDTKLAIIFGTVSINKPLLLWVNDGLMAIFFLLVGLELKREFVQGELSERSQIVLPLLGAVGGFCVPALIYAVINYNNPNTMSGWAIPSATDIAFALGVLSLLGDKVPLSLKVLLTSMAIIDDLAAILVIGLFYSGDLSTIALGSSAVTALFLLLINRMGVLKLGPYLFLGLVLWVCVLKSGVHATLAGVIVAFAIPIKSKALGENYSPLIKLEHALHPWVTYRILPLFAFANAGVPLLGISSETIFNEVSLGIAAGLILGKQLGVFGCIFLAVKFGFSRLPNDICLKCVYGISLLTGIGFTMSLFIGSLAFEHGDFDYLNSVRISVLSSSFICAVLGYCILSSILKNSD